MASPTWSICLPRPSDPAPDQPPPGRGDAPRQAVIRPRGDRVRRRHLTLRRRGARGDASDSRRGSWARRSDDRSSQLPPASVPTSGSAGRITGCFPDGALPPPPGRLEVVTVPPRGPARALPGTAAANHAVRSSTRPAPPRRRANARERPRGRTSPRTNGWFRSR